MNAIMNVNTMTSREIAELTGKEHYNVLRTIRDLIDGQILSPQIEALKSEYRGRELEYYALNKRDSLVLVARLSPEFTAAVVDRWQELEGAAPKLPQTFAEALRLAADQAEQIALMAPKAEFVDKYVDATGLMGFREVAKLLKVKENKLRDFVVERKIMYRLSGRMTPYAQHIDAGRFSVKTGEADNGHAFTQSKFTPKGVNWIAELLANEEACEYVRQLPH